MTVHSTVMIDTIEMVLVGAHSYDWLLNPCWQQGLTSKIRFTTPWKRQSHRGLWFVIYRSDRKKRVSVDIPYFSESAPIYSEVRSFYQRPDLIRPDQGTKSMIQSKRNIHFRHGDWLRFNVPINTLEVILETSLSSQSSTCTGTDNLIRTTKIQHMEREPMKLAVMNVCIVGNWQFHRSTTQIVHAR